VHGHQPDARLFGAFDFVGFGQQRQAIDEAAEARAILAQFVLTRGGDEFQQVFLAAFRFLRRLLAQRAQIPRLIEHLAQRDRDRLVLGHLRHRDEEIVEAFERRVRPRRQRALHDEIFRARPQRSTRTRIVQPCRQQRRRIAGDRERIRLFQRVHHRLANAARRRVHHPPEADIIVRVD
jgi:hypothetical protein